MRSPRGWKPTSSKFRASGKEGTAFAVSVNPLVISFVSGKGGVGKTSLAANFAWLCGRVGKTVLIDLDFQNQGATGLFLALLPTDACGASDALAGPNDFSRCEPIRVEENVFFIPAIPLHNPLEYSKMADLMRDPALVVRLRAFLNYLQSRFLFDILILDCHGGLDYVSVAAHALSDETVVVTEADTVTFNGTLELLDFYSAQRSSLETAAIGAVAGSVLETPMFEARQRAEPPESTGRISFVVNRLPSKYRFRDVDSTYTRLIANYGGDLRLRPSVLSFIPEENFLAESFGEYPFCVKLAPTSVVARKLQLMMTDLIVPDPSTMRSYRPLRRLRSKRYRSKVREIVVSAESRNTKNIIYAFGWLWTLFSAAMVALICFSFWGVAHPHPDGFLDFFLNPLLGVFIVLFFLPFGYYCVRAQFGLMFYYNSVYRFRRALIRTTGSPLNLWQKLSLVRLWLLRLGSAIGPLFLLPMTLIYIVGGALIALRFVPL
ncbi:MAG: ParA family protein [Bryobacterales bacterium]|nr:ParA family protein [Bryobacterales bacterium]